MASSLPAPDLQWAGVSRVDNQEVDSLAIRRCRSSSLQCSSSNNISNHHNNSKADTTVWAAAILPVLVIPLECLAQSLDPILNLCHRNNRPDVWTPIKCPAPFK